jgi:hypothetical protein
MFTPVGVTMIIISFVAYWRRRRCGGGTGFNPAFTFVLVFIASFPSTLLTRASTPGGAASFQVRLGFHCLAPFFLSDACSCTSFPT